MALNLYWQGMIGLLKQQLLVRQKRLAKVEKLKRVRKLKHLKWGIPLPAQREPHSGQPPLVAGLALLPVTEWQIG